MTQLQTVQAKQEGLKDWAVKVLVPNLSDALPKTLGLTPEGFMRAFYTSVRRNPQLLDCDRQSLYSELMTAAQFGIQIDGVHAGLATFREKGVPRAKLMVMYRGLTAMAMRSGLVEAIYPPQLVYRQDKFRVAYGLSPTLEHEPDFEGERNLDDMIGAYCVVQLKGGAKVFEYLPRTALDALRNRSKARSDDSPWNTSPDEMYRKCPVRAVCKRVPTASEDAGALLQLAITREEADEAGQPIAADFELKEERPAVKVTRRDLKDLMPAPVGDDAPWASPDPQPEPTAEEIHGESQELAGGALLAFAKKMAGKVDEWFDSESGIPGVAVKKTWRELSEATLPNYKAALADMVQKTAEEFAKTRGIHYTYSARAVVTQDIRDNPI